MPNATEAQVPQKAKKSKKCVGAEYTNTSQAAKALVTPEVRQQAIAIYEYGKTSEEQKQSYTLMELSSKALNLSAVEITPFDMCLVDCVYTMYRKMFQADDNAFVFTIEELANTLMKKEVKFKHTEENFADTFNAMKLEAKYNPTLSEEELDFYNRLHLSMHKMMNTVIRFDCSQIKAPDGESVFERHIVYGAMLPLEIYEHTSPVKKEQKIGYKVLGKPILFRYAERLNRIGQYPAKMLKTGLPAAVDSVVLGREIASIITLMKNPNNSYSSRDITYEWYQGRERKGLFERIGLHKESYATPQSWAKKKSKVHKNIGTILEKYKAEGTIKDYHENLDGKSKVGYHIVL